MMLQYGLDDLPSRFDRIFPGEQRRAAVHRVADEAVVSRPFVGLLVEEAQLALIAHERLSGPLDARGQGDDRPGR